MPELTDLPPEVILDNILPWVPIPDLMHLAATNKLFNDLCNDDTFWKRRLQRDYNFSGQGTARTSGWKFVYRGLSKPQVFVWGETSQGRLGLNKFPQVTMSGVPFPVRLRMPGVRVVSLVAGGMSFHALDSEGNIHVWGTLDGSSYALKSDGFSRPGKTANTPIRLVMPAPTRSISCGRLHATTLDSLGHIWTFPSWGRPFKLSSPLLDASPALQIECGWNFSAFLSRGGEVFVWWPLDEGRVAKRVEARDATIDGEGDEAETVDKEKNRATLGEDGAVRCAEWTLDVKVGTGADEEVELVRLPGLPALPALHGEHDEEVKLISIAGLDRQLVGLTNKGHVLRFFNLSSEAESLRGRWEYLPYFSEVEKVLEHPAFTNGTVSPPGAMQITHISANFNHFIAYSTPPSPSIVLIGTTTTAPTPPVLSSPDNSPELSPHLPQIIPALQNRSVISVVLGDYHSAALTQDGALLTWGAFSKGALGLGDPVKIDAGRPGGFATAEERWAAERGAGRRGRGEPPRVEVPTEVGFGRGRREGKGKRNVGDNSLSADNKPKSGKFCLQAAAAGWHTGALVIDLDETEYDDSEAFDLDQGAEEVEAAFSPSTSSPISRGYESPPFVPLPGIAPTPRGRGWGLGPIRIGFAGRGGFLSRGGGNRGGFGGGAGGGGQGEGGPDQHAA